MTVTSMVSRPIVDLRAGRGIGSEYKLIPPSTTIYIPIGAISHLDSVYGIDLFVRGMRGGANDIDITVQHASYNDSTATWADIGTGKLGAAGDGAIGAEVSKDVTINATPTAPATLLNYIRIKIVTGAATQGMLAIVTRTCRGDQV